MYLRHHEQAIRKNRIEESHAYILITRLTLYE